LHPPACQFARLRQLIDLIEDLMSGETYSVAGVYQVMAALRRLAQWVNDKYWPWFEREVLGMDVAVEL